MKMLAGPVDHVIGVDTHRDTHAAAICDARGAVVAELEALADGPGYAALLAQARTLGPGRRVWALEGASSYGAGLCRHLQGAGECVYEVERPTRRRRPAAKSDALDALAAARAALSGRGLASPRAGGSREALRVLVATRAGAVVARTTAIGQLKALLVGAPEPLRARLRHHTTLTQLRACAALRPRPSQPPAERELRHCLAATAARALRLGAEADALEARIGQLVGELAPGLLGELGVGPINAAALIVAYSHHGRLRSEAAFAALAGVAPLEASSGQSERHRLNRGGDRQLNRALHMITISRLGQHPETRAYAARRRAEGKSPREIRRCLKRHLARRLYRLLTAEPALSPTS